MIITNLSGNSEMLTDHKDLTRRRRVNGNHSLSFLLFKTAKNEHAFDLVQEESKLTYEDNEYRIKGLEERLIGKTPVKQVQADHVFFDIIEDYQYETITGVKSIEDALTFILNGTGYTFTLHDAFSTAKLEKFGDDTSLSLFQKALQIFGAEFEVSGSVIHIRKKIGLVTDFQFRYKHNIKTLSKSIKTDNLSTYIKGYGKQNDDGTYVCAAEYTSPMADIYGIRHAKPIKDERFEDEIELFNHLKSQIIDYPDISITLDFVDLLKAGYQYESPGLGDTVYLIYEPLNIDITTRILEVTDYPESPKSPLVTLANYKVEFTDVLFRHTKSQMDKIYDDNTGKIRFAVLDEAVKIATEAINNSRTELQYPESGGIRAVDPNDRDRYVAFTSAGIGVTTDGGQSFPQAITADGIVAELISAGVIRGVTIEGGTISSNSIINVGTNAFIGNNLYLGSLATDGQPKGIWFNGQANIHGGTGFIGASIDASCDEFTIDGRFNVLGEKNATVKTSRGWVNVSAYETAEYYFGDIRRDYIVDGVCEVNIEEIFGETVNTEIQYEVFVTPYDQGHVWVDWESMKPKGFIVRGSADIPFAYEIKAKRRGFENVRLILNRRMNENDITS